MIFQKYRFFTFKEIQYFFSRQSRAVDAGGMCGFKRLHEGDVIFYALLTDEAVFLRVEPAFVVQQHYVAFTDDAFGVLFVPFFSSREE